MISTGVRDLALALPLARSLSQTHSLLIGAPPPAASPRRRHGAISSEQFDAMINTAFEPLRLRHDEIKALRKPYSTPSGLVKWRPFADALMGRTGL
jgi:hypothetical protein